MEDENLVHRRFDNRVDYIFFSRYAKSHAQEIASIAKVVIWIKERLTSRIFIGHCSESGHLRNKAMASHNTLIGTIDVCGIVIEGGERTYQTTHDRHGIRDEQENPQEV